MVNLKSGLGKARVGTPGLGVFIALSTIVWGIIFITSTNVPDVLDTVMLLQKILPLWAWGSFFISLGLAQILAIMTTNLTARKRAGLVTFALWMFVTFMDMIPAGFSSTTMMFGLYTLGEFFVYLSLFLVPKEK